MKRTLCSFPMRFHPSLPTSVTSIECGIKWKEERDIGSVDINGKECNFIPRRNNNKQVRVYSRRKGVSFPGESMQCENAEK